MSLTQQGSVSTPMNMSPVYFFFFLSFSVLKNSSPPGSLEFVETLPGISLASFIMPVSAFVLFFLPKVLFFAVVAGCYFWLCIRVHLMVVPISSSAISQSLGKRFTSALNVREEI